MSEISLSPKVQCERTFGLFVNLMRAVIRSTYYTLTYEYTDRLVLWGKKTLALTLPNIENAYFKYFKFEQLRNVKLWH